MPNANALGTNVQTIYSVSYISGGPKKVAQLLVGHNFKTVRKNSTKLHTTLSQHVFNHLSYNLNRCIAQLSSCSDFNVQQTGLAQKDSTVVALITMALIATQDFRRVS